MQQQQLCLALQWCPYLLLDTEVVTCQVLSAVVVLLPCAGAAVGPMTCPVHWILLSDEAVLC